LFKFYVVYTLYFLTFHILKNQQNAVITLLQNRTQNTIYIRCQLLHVFGTKVPSSGSFSATKVLRFNKYFRHHSPTLPS